MAIKLKAPNAPTYAKSLGPLIQIWIDIPPPYRMMFEVLLQASYGRFEPSRADQAWEKEKMIRC